MISFRSNAMKLTSLTFLVIALVLITLILAESPNLKNVDFKLLPNNSSKLVPKSSKSHSNFSALEPNTSAQQPNANYLGNNQPQTTPNYPNNLINLLAPALLPGLNPSLLNPAEQQITPYQLQNASPQQLQRLRQLQEAQQLQRQRGNGGLTDLIGAFLPGGPNSLIGARQPNGLANANSPNNGNNNQNPAILAQLLGLAPQQPNNGGALSALGLNPYGNNNNALNQQQQNLQNANARQNANLRSSNNAATGNDDSNSNDNSTDNKDATNEDNGENGQGDNSGENNEEEGDQSQSGQQDPSQDPDIQQFNNLQGNDNSNFPGDLFPKGILSETDLKDIQKSMEEQAKKEAEKQKQQEGGEDEEGNSEDESGNGESDQSAGDQSSNEGTNADQTEGNKDEAGDSNAETDAKNDQSDTNNGKLSANNAQVNPGHVNLKPPSNRPTNSYSYNSLRPAQPNNYQNVNSNVQYEDDKSNTGQSYRPKINNNLPASRDYSSQRQPGYDQDDQYRSNRPSIGSRFNDYRGTSGGGLSGNPYSNNNYGSQVDYSPEYNQDRLNNADRFNQVPIFTIHRPNIIR